MDVSYKLSPLSPELIQFPSFCTVLDGAKTGKTILPGRYHEDRCSRKYGTHYVPEWKAAQDNLVHQHPLSRQGLPTFVMDVLKAAMDEACSTQFQRIEAQFSTLPKHRDTDLVAPWQEAEAGAQELLSRPEDELHARNVGRAQQDALEAIKRHVMRVYELSSTLMKLATPGGEKGKKAAFTNRSIESRQDQLRRLSTEFTSGPDRAETVGLLSEDDVARLRASFAYLYDWTRRSGGTRFPWNVAMRELGVIKLRARRELKPISQDFYEKMLMRRL
jgi:RNA-dependent RNA polymerase